jgi:hypothetical protein
MSVNAETRGLSLLGLLGTVGQRDHFATVS